MNGKEAGFLRDRALRDRAWAVLKEQADRVRADLSARSVSSRAATTVAEEARGAAGAGVSLARENKGVLAGTIVALLVWLFRDQILLGLNDLAGRSDDGSEEPDSQNGEPKREQED
jgi:hypothetical protein